MAARDDQQLKETRRGLPWRETVSQAPAVVLVGGLLMYGYLSICYDRFYGSLGVDPKDVGLTYAGTLARSSGFVILCLVFFVLTLPVLIVNGRGWLKDPTAKRPRLWGVLSVLILVALIFLVFRAPLINARYAALRVQEGFPVGPVQYPQGSASRRGLALPILAIRAEPAYVEPAGKPKDSPAVQQLRGHDLLYLGQSEGTVLLYDINTKSAIYLPASSIVLHVVNCGREPRHPTCINAENPFP